MKLLFIILPSLLLSTTVTAQSPKSHNEIYSHFLKQKIEILEGRDLISESAKFVQFFVDSLKRKGVDTLGIYQLDDVGSIHFDTCRVQNQTKDIYIQWRSNNIDYHKNLTSKCSTIQEIEKSSIISFYNKFQSSIDTSHILLSITEIDEAGNITFFSVSHDTRYSIYCELGLKSYYTFLSGKDIHHKEGLFYEENRTSIIMDWIKYMNSQVDRLER